MGDQIGAALTGVLEYVGKKEIDRVISLNADIQAKKRLLADICRLNSLYMIARAGSGHIGSSFSSMEIMTTILFESVGPAGANANALFFSSKGHDAPALYSNLLAFGVLNFDLIHGLRTLNGLPGHPDVKVPGVITNTGSLGMGISKAKGFIQAARLKGERQEVIVLTGDGELQEGQIWESLLSAVNAGMDELTIIVDHNKLQSDTFVSAVQDLGDLERKFNAFGVDVFRCDGNDISALTNVLNRRREGSGRPRVLIADTVKGCGVSFMEHTAFDSDVELYKYHSGAPDSDSYVSALDELRRKINHGLEAHNASSIETIKVDRAPIPHSQNTSIRLIDSYSAAIVDLAAMNDSIVALDADLVLDTGLIAFEEKFGNRFFECGIAEQDMVSQAGAMALSGLTPVVHSFACFLTARPVEQIYNNATEKTRIVYVGSLAGLVPAGPGHSHQGIRDIATMSSIPNMTVIEPSSPSQVHAALDWALNKNTNSTYIRLCSVPVVIKQDQKLPPFGRGVFCRDGIAGAIVCYGPVMIKNAMDAAERLSSEGVEVAVINMPWLSDIDVRWFEEVARELRKILVVDNHYVKGGLADRIKAAVIESGVKDIEIGSVGVGDVPVCGTTDEVLKYHGLDAESFVEFFIPNAM